MPVLIRFLGSGAVPPASQVFLRYIVACISALAYFRLSKQKFTVRKKELGALLVIALFGYALTNLLYTYAILLTQIGTVLFIFFSASVITPILARIFLNEEITKTKMAAILLGVFSLFFLFRPGPVSTWKLGALFAAASAICQAIYVIGRKKVPHVSAPTLLVINTIVGVVGVGFISAITEASFYTHQGIGALSSVTWIVTILFGILNFAAWLLMTKGFSLVTAGAGSLVMLSENFIGILFAFLFFAEIPSVSTAIGGIFVLTASLLVIRAGE